ncbi:MAG: DUF1592 domain-containing protein, partial [Polyangiaceae bacterium]|nr:DUF1592 domain-containing protein [Polyangiaceae bacterium]
SSLSPDPISEYGFDNEAIKLLVSKQTARELNATTEELAAAIEMNIGAILPCAAQADQACAQEFLATYGQRLFRRPLTADEVERYLSFFDEAAAASGFAPAIGWLSRALILAPATLYRSEIGSVVSQARSLSPFEVATALAYTFSGAPPDDALLQDAANGLLDDPEVLREKALSLLSTERGKEQIHRFFEAFLGYARVSSISKSGIVDFESLRNDMREETRRFIEAVVIEERGGFPELLTASATYPSTALAGFYGFTPPASDYASLERPAGRGIGVLAQGSVLATEASPDSSSPTQRGLLVHDRFLCAPPLEVPADVPEIPVVEVGVTTTRERYEVLHVASPLCNSCHSQFDPIGFAFEHFDEVGRFRETEGGLPINASGAIPPIDGAPAVSGQEDLARSLAELPEVGECISSQIKTYGFGAEEACLGEGERAKFIAGTIGFVDYLASLATEPHFRSRALNEIAHEE